VLLLAVVLVAGRVILGFFGISVPIVQLAGGLVLAAMGWTMLFSPDDTSSRTKAADTSGNPPADYDGRIFYPFTFPLTVGPGGVAVAITLSAHTSREHLVATVAAQLGSFIGILAVAVVTYFCLANAGRIAARQKRSSSSAWARRSPGTAHACCSGCRPQAADVASAGACIRRQVRTRFAARNSLD
jgi:multiple antibiotic resistance protein